MAQLRHHRWCAAQGGESERAWSRATWQEGGGGCTTHNKQRQQYVEQMAVHVSHAVALSK